MDVFIEKIVAKRKTSQDYLVIAGIVLGGLLLLFVLPMIPVIGQLIGSMWLFVIAAVAFGVYYFAKSRNLEFEYAVTNGDLDIDKIIAQRKRKRIFSVNCKEFDIVARVRSDKFTPQIKNMQKHIEAVSSMDSPDVFFLTAPYKGERVVVFFEPDQRMLDSFKTYIPRKVFE